MAVVALQLIPDVLERGLYLGVYDFACPRVDELFNIAVVGRFLGEFELMAERLLVGGTRLRVLLCLSDELVDPVEAIGDVLRVLRCGPLVMVVVVRPWGGKGAKGECKNGGNLDLQHVKD